MGGQAREAAEEVAAFEARIAAMESENARVHRPELTLRQLAQVDRPVTILAYQAIGVGLMMLPPAIYFWTTPNGFKISVMLEEMGVPYDVKFVVMEAAL